MRSEESEEIQARKRSLKKHPVTDKVTGCFFNGPRSHESSRSKYGKPRHPTGDGVFFQRASFTRIISKIRQPIGA